VSEGGIVPQPQEQPDAETAFIIVKELDGSFRATTDLASSFLVARDANRADIRQACRELSEAIAQDELAERVAARLQSE
jgi:hypothetical protein